MSKISSDNYIRIIAEVKSISIAADIIGISQPGLSAFLKKEEQRLGTAIFDRSHQPIELTEAGRIYLEYLDRTRALKNELTQNIADIEGIKTGKLTFGGASFFNVAYVPKAVKLFSEAYPGIEIEIVDGSVPELTTYAQKGTIDLFITPVAGDEERFAYEELLEEKIFIVVPEEWEVNKKLSDKEVKPKDIIDGNTDNLPKLTKAEFKQLCEKPFVILRNNQDIGQKIEQLFAKYQCRPERIITAEQTMTTLALSMAGAGASLLTESSLKRIEKLGLPKVYFIDEKFCSRKMFVAYPKNKYLSKPAEKFIEFLKETNK